MKKQILHCILLCFLISSGIFAQTMKSNYGNIIPVHASAAHPLKIMFVFADYPTGSPCEGVSVPSLYDSNGLPLNANTLVDPVLPIGGPTSFFSKYFYEASFGQFVLLGDYVVDPVHLTCGQGDNDVLAELNNRYNSGTLNFGHYSSSGPNYLNQFDEHTIPTGNAPYEYKPSVPDLGIDVLIMLYSNSKPGGCNSGAGCSKYFWGQGPKIGPYAINSGSSFHTCGDQNGTDFILQELFHCMYGGNNWHSGAGAGHHAFPIPTQPWGVSAQINGAGMSSTPCGWDRQFCGWKGWSDIGKTTQKQNLISAINAITGLEQNTEFLNFGTYPNSAEYILRDFQSYGDVIKIQLPFINFAGLGSVKNQYLWIENHQLISSYDHGAWESGGCKDPWSPGIYAMVQVGKDILDNSDPSLLMDPSPYSSVYYPQPNDAASWLYPLTAEGNYDFFYSNPTTITGSCWAGITCYPTNMYSPLTQANPLTGYSEIYNIINSVNDGLINRVNDPVQVGFAELDPGGTVLFNANGKGDSKDAFSFANGNVKISLCTNPSSSPVYTLLSGENLAIPANGQELATYENRTIWLNGISVEILQENVNPAVYGQGAIKVRVRFDDYDIDRDTRWCGEIKLSPNAQNQSLPSLVLKSGKTLRIDRGKSPTSMRATSNVLDANGNWVFTLPTNFTCLPNTYIKMEANANITVENGSTFTLKSNSRLDIGANSILRIKGASNLIVESGAQINVEAGGKIIIEEDAASSYINNSKLVYYDNVSLKLNNTAELEIAGNLELRDNAIFSPSSISNPPYLMGSVKFSSTKLQSYNITSGANCKMIFQSNAKSRKILYVVQETLHAPNLTEFTLQSGTAVLSSGSRIFAPINANASIKFINSTVTSHNNLRTNQRGTFLFGQGNVVVSNSSFMNGQFGLYAYNALNHNNLFITNCYFGNNGTGIFSYDKALTLNGVHIWNCDKGWESQMMTGPSRMHNASSVTTCSNFGISYQSNGTGPLMLMDPMVTLNPIGVIMKGTTLQTWCGSISNNSNYGVYLKDNSSAQIGNMQLGQTSGVTMINNGTTIKCLKTNTLLLNNGNNNFTPLSSGSQNVINGTMLLCANYATIPAYGNKWNLAGSPLNTSDYYLTNSCISPSLVTLSDPAPVASLLCGQAIPPCSPPPCASDLVDPLKNCNNCESIYTADYYNKKLNEASMLASDIAKDDTLPDNEKIAIDRFNQILMEPLISINENEEYILNYDYQLMLQTLGEAFSKGQLLRDAGANIDLYVQKVLEVQDRLITEAINKGRYETRFYVSIEKAEVYRMAGKSDHALSQMDNVIGFAEGEDYYDANKFRCLILTEKDVEQGRIPIDEIVEAINQCGNGGTSNRIMSPSHIIDTPKNNALINANSLTEGEEGVLYPNPAGQEITVEGFNNSINEILIKNVLGQVILKETFEGTMNLLIESLSPGVYIYQIRNNLGRNKEGKLTKD